MEPNPQAPFSRAKENFEVHFLALENNPPKWYYFIHNYLAQLGTTTILSNFLTIKEMAKKKRVEFIISESTLLAKRRFEQNIKHQLPLLLRKGVLSVHHISSFAIRQEFIQLRNRKHYYLYQMPFNLATFCQCLQAEFINPDETNLQWPGGRKAGLPMGHSR